MTDPKATALPGAAPAPLPESLRGKKIVLVNHGDTLGGAAVVTFRLMQALRERGLDVRMIVYTKNSKEELVETVATRYVRGMAFCLERAWMWIFGGVARENIFKVSTGDFAVNIHRHKWVREADIVCLNWFNQGLLNFRGIRKLHRMGKKLVWTMHDLWAFTGICHHPQQCDHYLDKCGGCMYLESGGSLTDISHRVWNKKKKTYAEVPVTFVAVSRWLEEKARSSSLLRDRPVMTIHNPFPVHRYFTRPTANVGSLSLGSYKPNLIIMAAARLDDPIKGLDIAIDALNIIFDHYPEEAQKTAVYFVGVIRDPSVLSRLRFSYRHLGLIRDEKVMRMLYAMSRIVLSTSLYETLGATLVEGQAAGAIPVTFGGDGREDVVRHLETGYIARGRDAASIAEGILWAIRNDVDRDMLHREALSNFGAEACTDRYIELFSSLV